MSTPEEYCDCANCKRWDGTLGPCASKAVCDGPTYPRKKAMWDVWQDFFIKKIPWRMLTPLGIIAYRTKRAALEEKAKYLRTQALNLPAPFTAPFMWSGEGI